MHKNPTGLGMFIWTPFPPAREHKLLEMMNVINKFHLPHQITGAG